MTERQQIRTRIPIEPSLYRAGVRFNMIILGLAFGLSCALIILLATYISIAVHGRAAGQFLNILEVFMPGYSATPVGAWVGFAWTFVYASMSGSFIYWVYARFVGTHLVDQLYFDPDAPPSPVTLTLRLSGRALGLAIGSLLAAQLFASTCWLMIRGTAHVSKHAALLAQYLPGYSVTLPGAFMGSIWMLIYSCGFSLIFAGVYNRLLAFRMSRRPSGRR